MPPQASPHVCARENSLHFFDSPLARITSAVFLLIAGVSLAAVFWKMPQSGQACALYQKETVDQNLAAVQLPGETVDMLTMEEMRQLSLPELDVAPAVEAGAEKYAQMYPAPPGLAAMTAEQNNAFPLAVEEPAPEPSIPKTLEPMRPPIEDQDTISVESVKPTFQPKPTSINPAERSEELLSEFRFAEGSRANFDPPPAPADPFMEMASSLPVLQPLESIEPNRLSPLQPLKESELSMPVLASQ